MASISVEVAVAGAGGHLMREHIDGVLVAEALDLILGRIVGVINLARPVHGSGLHALRLRPVQHGAQGPTGEDRSGKNVLWASTEDTGRGEPANEHHRDGMVDEHGTQVGLIVVPHEVDHQVVGKGNASAGKSVVGRSVLKQSKVGAGLVQFQGE